MFDPFVSPYVPLQNDNPVSVPLTIHKRNNNVIKENVQRRGLT